MKVQARAKINLTLNVLGRRNDGYHDLELIFQPVSLCDELDIEENDTGELIFTCSIPEFQEENNLVCRGYRKMKELFPDRIGGLTIHLTKRIPSGAGMGGGSTDCSALLLWMNEHYRLGLDRQTLIDIGVTLGADVPACMIPHATMGTGVGEILTDIHMHRSYPLLLIKPDISFNTGEMFRRLDEAGFAHQRRTAPAMVSAMEAGDLIAMGQNLYNVFEEVVPCREQIVDWKKKLMDTGALGSLMTGAGSVVYGIFETEETRDAAYQKLSCLSGCQLYTCEAVNL